MQTQGGEGAKEKESVPPIYDEVNKFSSAVSKWGEGGEGGGEVGRGEKGQREEEKGRGKDLVCNGVSWEFNLWSTGLQIRWRCVLCQLSWASESMVKALTASLGY